MEDELQEELETVEEEQEEVEDQADLEESDDKTEDDDEPEAQDGEEPDETAPEEFTVEIATEEPGEDESAPFRALRKKARELEKKLKEYESKGKVEELGEKPKLEDFDYDSEKHEDALLKWHDRKRDVDARAEQERQEQERREQAYQDRLKGYEESKRSLGAKDFDAAEEEVRETLSTAQQSIIVAHAKRPELVVYALGKNPKKAAELAGEADPIAFAYKLAALENTMKVTGTAKPAPEKRVKGGSATPAVGSKRLEQARKKAEQTGDYTEVRRIKKELRAK